VSLKAFHLFFIAVCILFTLGFGAWGIVDFRHSENIANLVLGIFSLVISIGLLAYCGYVVRKLKGVRLI